MSSQQRLWLIGGTSESSEIAKHLIQQGIPCTVTVTTETARSLYPHSPLLRVIVGRMNAVQIQEFLQLEQIAAILDATHPYAVEISQTAIALSTQNRLPYLRYERPEVVQTAGKRLTFPSFESLLKSNILLSKRVLLTIGYQALPLFQSWQTQATLFTRILPSVASLQTALDAGFSSDRIIAFRPPISADLERALWQQWQINLVVTKASGNAGGEAIKYQIGEELNIPIVVVTRPVVDYPQQTSEIAITLQFCHQFIPDCSRK